MEINWTKNRAVKALCIAFVLGLMTACGGGGGSGGSGNNGNQLADVGQYYSGKTTKAEITTANASAFTTEAFAFASVGSSADILGKFIPRDTSGSTVTLPEIAELVKAGLDKAMVKRAAAQAVVGAASSNTIAGSAGGSALLAVNVDDATGNFTGQITFSSYKEVATGPIINGVVKVSGLYNKTTNSYDTMTMEFTPLTAVTAKGSTELFGKFVFSLQGTTETLKMTCILRFSTGSTFWVKDWTYTFSDGAITITGVYYHPLYGFVEVETPWRLTVTSFSANPTSGVFQAAGTGCTKARMTFTATGSTVTAAVEGTPGWVSCTE